MPAILIIGFLVSLLGTFTLCIVLARKWAQARADLDDWKARKLEQHLRVEAENDVAWRRNKEMLMY